MTDAILRNGRAIWLAVLLLTLGGVFAGTRLPVSLFPLID
jgi:multidrug efflux pump subunit AcrB